MMFQSPMLIVSDMERSKAFYREVLGLQVVLDFGTNVTLTGGIALQTKESWREFIGRDTHAVVFGGNDAELYFEEEAFDAFLERLAAIDTIRYVHPAYTHRWGQRVVRFYDPDQHILEVGERMKDVCRRFLDSGMTVEEAAARMDVPVSYVLSMTSA